MLLGDLLIMNKAQMTVVDQKASLSVSGGSRNNGGPVLLQLPFKYRNGFRRGNIAWKAVHRGCNPRGKPMPLVRESWWGAIDKREDPVGQ